ncbi:hypothetical protein ACFS5N_10710 [Mucilaginibacter ximonensis]|uniref:FecR family protein n=1 Tax=Mucilaginibacter ximonensis TaxID=538021 RepID=A0ABW5YCB5_9SPHI
MVYYAGASVGVLAITLSLFFANRVVFSRLEATRASLRTADRKKNNFLRDLPDKRNLLQKQSKMNERPYSERLQILAKQYLRGELNPKEQQEVDEWFLSDEGADFLKSEMSKDEYSKLLLRRIHKQAGIRKIATRPKRIYLRVAVAASLILATTLGTYIALNKTPIKQQDHELAATQIKPGGAKATLILANGKSVTLMSRNPGLLARQGNVQVYKNQNGSLSYATDRGDIAKAATLYNMVTTPRGGKYSLTLSDGTIAILDAASSIRFPVSFDKERNVTITGQVYFEVIHNAARPSMIQNYWRTVIRMHLTCSTIVIGTGY